MGKDDVMMHADGPLKMEDKDGHTQNSASSYDYKCFTKQIPQGFFRVAIFSSVCNFRLCLFDDLERSHFFKITTRS